jgi:hypothetical protein
VTDFNRVLCVSYNVTLNVRLLGQRRSEKMCGRMKQNKKRIKSKFLVANVQAGVTGSNVLKPGTLVSPSNLLHLLIIEGILTMYYRFC